MKNRSKITLALAAIGTAALVIYLTRYVKTKHILKQVSEEGYETASDILFPGKDATAKDLRYGPVLPV